MIKEKKYKNGATLIYKKTKTKSTAVSVGFIFNNDISKNYPAGVAHFCEHMFFQETENRDYDTLKKDRKDIFSYKINGLTSMQYTYLDFCRSNKIIEPCFELASDMLLNTKFSQKCVDTERGVIKQENRLNVDKVERVMNAATRNVLNSNVSKTVNDVVSSLEDIEAITPEMLKKFRDENYVSQNFLIAIKGGISYHKAKRLAEKYFINKLRSDPAYSVCNDDLDSYKITNSGNMNTVKIKSKTSDIRIFIKFDDLKDKKLALKHLEAAKYFTSLSSSADGLLVGKLREKGLVYSANCRLACNKYYNSLLITLTTPNENINESIDTIGEFLKQSRNTPLDENLIKKMHLNEKYLLDELTPLPNYPNSLFKNYIMETREELFSKKYMKEKKKIKDNITAKDIQDFCAYAFTKPENVYVTIGTNLPKEDFYDYYDIQRILTTDKALPRKKQAKKSKEVTRETSNNNNLTQDNDEDKTSIDILPPITEKRPKEIKEIDKPDFTR